MLYDVDIEASACVLSSRYAMLCYVCFYCMVAFCQSVLLKRDDDDDDDDELTYIVEFLPPRR